MTAEELMTKLTRNEDHHERVREMMRGYGQAVRDVPTMPKDPEERVRIAALILEELLEFIHAIGLSLYDYETGLHVRRPKVRQVLGAETDLVEAADGAADLSVVVNCAMAALGLPVTELLEEVDRNNLTKIANGRLDPESGKFIKPDNHQPPDIKTILKNAGWAGA